MESSFVGVGAFGEDVIELGVVLEVVAEESFPAVAAYVQVMASLSPLSSFSQTGPKMDSPFT